LYQVGTALFGCIATKIYAPAFGRLTVICEREYEEMNTSEKNCVAISTSRHPAVTPPTIRLTEARVKAGVVSEAEVRVALVPMSN